MALINKVLPGYVATLWCQTGSNPTALTDTQLSTWTGQVADIIGTSAGGTGLDGEQIPVEAVPAFGADDAFAAYLIAGQRTGAKITTQNQVTSLTITAPWTRATPKSAPVAGGFVKITNTGSESDWLIGGSFTGAGRVEVHEMATDNGVMRMRQLANGLEIKPGQTVELKPGGFHLMFMELKQPTVEGKPIRGTLTFRKAGSVEIDFAVAPIGGPAPASGGGHHHH